MDSINIIVPIYRNKFDNKEYSKHDIRCINNWNEETKDDEPLKYLYILKEN